MSNKIKSMRALLLLLLTVVSLNAFAQKVTVKVNVKDTSGEAIIGASVVEKGTSNGGSTGVNGSYSISVSPDATVEVAFLGMITEEFKAGSRTEVDVVLKDDAQVMEEVVVIGYGTIAKRDLTGSVASVSSKQLESIPVANVSEALTGRMPGVNISTTEGSPDADVKIRVRGGGSLSQDNSPLYIVDGFPVASISDIGPNEIQSIDVLKDASSTAIYGARGANGVLIITTKSGFEGKTQVNFTASHGIKNVVKMTKNLSPYDYAMYQYELGSTDYGTFPDMEIWKSAQGMDYQDEIFGRTGNQSQYNVNISGGSKETKFSVSYTHNEEKSIMLGSGFNKDNINAKINTQLNPWLKLDFNGRLSYQGVDGLGSGADTNESNAANSIVNQAVRFRPIDPLNASNEDDDENNTSKQYTPLERMNAVYKDKRTFNQNYNAGLSWNPIKNLTFRTEFGYGWKYINTDQAWETAATQNSSLKPSGQPQAVLTRQTNTNWRNANTVTYDNRKMFGGRDRMNIVLGHEVTSSQTKTNTMTSVGFPLSFTAKEMLAGMSNGTALPNESYIGAKDNMLSFFGRINYTMNEKYLFTATVRTDGSSKFGKDNRWGTFPSAAFAWRISEEDFMQNAQNWLSNLKLRLSFGTAGNNRINSGLISTTYSMSSNTAKAPYFDGIYNSMLELGDNLSNPNLKWETTVTRNFGIDYGLWNNRISGSIDLYWNTTKDLLMRASIPESSGYKYQYQNYGETSNKGIELSMTAILAETKDFNLDFNFNISYNRNKIDKLSNGSGWQSSNWAGSTLSKYEDFLVEEGGRLGEIWGYKTNGYYTVYNAETNPNGELVWGKGAWELVDGHPGDTSPSITGGPYYPGGMKFQLDEDGNPLKQKLGNTVPSWVGGFGFSGTFKNFDFNVFFNYSLGHKLINGTKLATSFYAGSAKGYNLNNDFALDNRYTWIDPVTGLNLGRPSNSTINEYGIEAIGDRLNEINKDANMYNPASASTMQLTDYAVENASFLRLNNLTIGYSLPKSLTSKIRLERVRVYLTGYNLYCFTNYSGTDPEVDVSSKRNAMTPGVDYAAYPKSRSFVAGINISF